MAGEYDNTTAFLQDKATQALLDARSSRASIDGLQNVRAITRDPNFDVKLTKPKLEAPPKFSDMVEAGDSSEATIQWLNDKADEWLDKYFPELNGCLRHQPEETLCAIISGVRPFGVDKTVFELVWHQARDRAYRTVASEKATLEADFSSRGFSLPPGALVDLTAQMDYKGQSQIMDVNRDQAMKDADIKVDLLKHALSLATQLKLGVMDAMARFYMAWISLPDKDLERARIKAQATASFYSALSSYYNVEIAFQELTLKAAQTDASVDIDVDRNTLTKQGNYMGTSGALGSAVNAFADLSGKAALAGSTLSATIESS